MVTRNLAAAFLPHMEHLLLIFTILNLVLVATHAVLPPELYWKSVLPTTPMPKAITDILHPGKGNGTNVNKGDMWKPVAKYWPILPYIGYAATETQLLANPNVALFFLEKDLHQGIKKFKVQFTKSSINAPFCTRQVADSIPFSSNKVQGIFNKFSVQPGSLKAQVIQKTIKVCEAPGIRGESKYCATSLESMVDFSTSKLGKNVEALSTEVDKEETKLQEYTTTPGVKKIAFAGDKAIACHKQDYPYAVFYCHTTGAIRAFNVPLEGADGTRVKAVAVCHTDTSPWNHGHASFQVLKVKPGTPVCHLLPEDHVLWVPK